MFKKVFFRVFSVFVLILIMYVFVVDHNSGRFDAQSAQAASATYYQTYIWRDFHPFQSSANMSFAGDGANRRLYVASGPGEVTTRLQLPQGARVVEVTYYYFKNTVTPMDIAMRINGENLATGEYVSVASSAPNSTSTNMQSVTLTVSPELAIDNSQYAYEIYVLMYSDTPDLGFRGARIGYTVPTVYLPLVHH